MSKRIIFSKEDLLKITELLQEQSLSEVSRQLGLNDLKLLYEKKYNTDLAEAIQKGISLRSKSLFKVLLICYKYIFNKLFKNIYA